MIGDVPCMKVVVFGLGYVGTVTAACLAANGHEVWGVDPQEAKVDAVVSGRSPVVEPGLDDLVEEGVRRGSLQATTDSAAAIRDADVSLISVGTPSRPSGSTDLSYVLRAVDDVAQALLAREGPNPPFHTVVIRSTVPPGTIDDAVIPALETALGCAAGTGFGVAMCPEFLREGSGIADFFDPPFTVVGTNDARVAEAVGHLLDFLACPMRVVPVRTAEGLKYACNAFHAMKVSFANELARLYRPLNVDSRDVMRLFCEDKRLNIAPSYLRPGFAFGGSCLPKDLRSLLYLGRMNSVDMPLLSGTLLSNDLTVQEVAQRAMVGGRRVALLGLSFKMETDDLRESPSVELAETLLGKGFDVRIFDPVIKPSRLLGTNLSYVEAKLPHLRRLLLDSPQEALACADLAIVSSNNPAALEALIADPPARIIDLDGRLGDEVQALPGYEGVGW